MTKPATTPRDLIQATGGLETTLLREGDRWSVWRSTYPVFGDKVEKHFLFLERNFRWQDVDQARAWLGPQPANPPLVIVRESRQKDRPPIGQVQVKLGAGKVMTPTEFLFQAVKTALAPSSAIHDEGEPFFIEPNLKFPNKSAPAPALKQLESWIMGEHETEENVAVLLAPAGVGKTTLSGQLFQRLLRASNAQIIPLLLVREQWEPLVNRGLVNLRDIWTTGITTWYPRSLLGAENLETYLGAGAIRPIFDGLDELCSNFPGDFNPSALIAELADTIEDGKLLLTSRPEFWSENIEPSVRTRVLELDLSPFTTRQRDDYLLKRFPNAPQKRNAAVRLLERIAGSAHVTAESEGIRGADENGGGWLSLEGRLDRIPYAVMMAAESVDVDAVKEAPGLLEQDEPVTGLIVALCERERIRQRLRLTARDQFRLMQVLAVEFGYLFDSSEFETGIATIAPDISTAETERLKHHALLRVQEDRFAFRYDFLRDYLTAVAVFEWLVGGSDPAVSASTILERCARSGAQLSEFWVGLTRRKAEAEVIRSLRKRWVETSSVKFRKEGLSRLALSYARLISRGDKDKATHLLTAAVGDSNNALRDLTLRGPVTGFNFSRTKFVGCRFADTEWSKCTFSQETAFSRCHFEGRLGFKNVTNFGLVRLEDCEFSAPAANAMQLERGNDREFPITREQILEAIREIIRLFAVGNLGFNPVSVQKLEKHIKDYSFGPKLLRGLVKHEVLKRGRMEIAGGAERYEIADTHAARQLINNALSIRGIGDTVEALLD